MTGPDEYSAIADNNVYTNLMAQRNLRLAADAVERHAERAAELGVDTEEAAAWRDAAQAMVIPYDEQLGVHPQAEGFTEHQRWDFARTTPERYPLLLHFPYVDLYRKQVVKQADLVLALHLRGDAFSKEQKARNFAYYGRSRQEREMRHMADAAEPPIPANLPARAPAPSNASPESVRSYRSQLTAGDDVVDPTTDNPSEVVASSKARLLLLLAPWPDSGHPGAMTIREKLYARRHAAKRASA